MEEILICDCNSCEHQIVIRHDKEDNLIYCDVHLVKYGFFRRLIFGIKYIFGYKSRYGSWDEFVFKPEHADKIIKIGNILKNGK